MPTIKKLKTSNKNINNKSVDSERYKKRRKIYNSALWEKMRMVQLQNHPLCEICQLEDKITLAIDVHHLDSFVDYDGMMMVEKAYNPNNFISLCKNCHNRVHNGDLRGCKTKDDIKAKIKNEC